MANRSRDIVRVTMPPPKSLATADEVVRTLRSMGSKKARDGMARFAIPSDRAFGIAMNELKALAKRIGHNHTLSLKLWKTGWYEARMLAVFIAEPTLVTRKLMDEWCRDFDSWAVCDHACFHLFDRTPHAFAKIAQWSKRTKEFERRAAFALLASVALHDKQAEDGPFLQCLPLIEAAAEDERNFVKKGVSWALRGIGRRNVALRKSAVEVAKRLSTSDSRSARWVGQDALRDLGKAQGKRGSQVKVRD
jgi:3-methyladenine DNA glycosylase AlkD